MISNLPSFSRSHIDANISLTIRMILCKIFFFVTASVLLSAGTAASTNFVHADTSAFTHDSSSKLKAFRRHKQLHIDCSMVFYNDLTTFDIASVESSLSAASAEMLQFLTCLNQESHLTITWTIASAHYAEAFVHWRKMVLRHDSRVFFAVALDKDAYESLRAARIPTILYQHNRTASDAIGTAKFSVSYGLHAHKRDFFFSEMDVFWSMNPVPFIPLGAEFAVSAHSYGAEHNIGFWYSKATEKTQLLYQRATIAARSVLEYSKIVGAMDQKILYVILSGNKKLYPADEFAAIDKYLDHVSGISWRYLPFDSFWHNMGADMEAWKLSLVRVTSHLTFGLTVPKHRVYAAKALGLWNDEEYENCSRPAITYGNHAADWRAEKELIKLTAALAHETKRSFYLPSAHVPHLVSLTSLSARVYDVLDHNFYSRCFQRKKQVSIKIVSCRSTRAPDLDYMSQVDQQHWPIFDTAAAIESLQQLRTVVSQYYNFDLIVLHDCHDLRADEDNEMAFCDSGRRRDDFCDAS